MLAWSATGNEPRFMSYTQIKVSNDGILQLRSAVNWLRHVAVNGLAKYIICSACQPHSTAVTALFCRLDMFIGFQSFTVNYSIKPIITNRDHSAPSIPLPSLYALPELFAMGSTHWC